MKNKSVYFENLDGLRFMCFLMVFFCHSFYTESAVVRTSQIWRFFSGSFLLANGQLGVNMFFVLSGFLITFLLIQEKKLNGQIDLKKFWFRRILRIWPLFYFCVFFGFVSFPFLKSFFGGTPNETANIFYYLTFINNFDVIAKGDPDASILSVLWSIAIEEQFYLLWPIVLFLLPVRRYWIAFTSVILVSWVFRATHDDPVMHEHHTLSCIGDMAIGAFGAWLVSEKKKFKARMENLKRYQIAIIYLTFFTIYIFRHELLFTNYIVRIFERSFIAIVGLGIILEQNYSKDSFFKFSNFKIISKLGLITYGLYCLHILGILTGQTLSKLLGIADNVWSVVIVEPLVAFSIAIVLAYFSFNYFEKPFLMLKEKYTYISRISPINLMRNKSGLRRISLWIMVLALSSVVVADVGLTDFKMY
ncbi:acyltransferase family protein [Mangrovibacterium diazotrophicum]|uniref:Peptidoglycan/LPS O-acetylase OafA/YrhL n=1 Tax=Mangrovibacterium diazotrophicum TaxID=1261403 RepID=A0A419VWZ6_9BACT|nr:acyltransferase [Mangrovibacterium diazotrophicum]RKD86522.1 peptidoglycan/LPS O-acetylase OafA/YrhL [Mangrovibacterium diazotrophicum]